MNPLEVMRRVYHEMVRRRSRPLFVPSEPARSSDPPIFVVGAYGSGTTLLRYILDSHSRLCGPAETSFLGPLSELLQLERNVEGLAALGLDQPASLAAFRELAETLFGRYAAARGRTRWFDKSPGHIGHLEPLSQLFPTARFVLLVRHGLDQAHSFSRGGALHREEFNAFDPSGGTLLAAVRYWCWTSQRIRTFLHREPERSHLLRYEDLCDAPETVVRRLVLHIGESYEPQMLRFWEHDHDLGNEHGRVQATRTIRATSRHWADWPNELTRRAFEIAGPELAAYGYPSTFDAADD